MAGYLASIHRVKRRDADLYRRRLRELIGHGECIMGLTDSYPQQYAFITESSFAPSKRHAIDGDGNCAAKRHDCPRSMGISIPGTSYSGGERISRSWTDPGESGATPRTM